MVLAQILGATWHWAQRRIWATACARSLYIPLLHHAGGWTHHASINV